MAEVKRLREALRRMFEAIVVEQVVDRGDLEIPNAGLQRGRGYAQLERAKAGRLLDRVWRREAKDAVSEVLAPIAEAAATLLTRKDLSLLRQCENPGCVLYFYDTSKNRARRWCSMDVCGNRMKVAAHYQRHHK